MTSLEQLGNRICIIGASNTGKSTMAHAIGRARGLPVVHLDQLYHLPDTDWVPRPKEDFVSLHDAAVLEETWVMEGNYSGCMPKRFARATGIIWLDAHVLPRLARYVRRTIFEKNRPGMLEGGIDRLNLKMVRFIITQHGRLRDRYAQILSAYPLTPLVRLHSLKAIDAQYREWNISPK